MNNVAQTPSDTPADLLPLTTSLDSLADASEIYLKVRANLAAHAKEAQAQYGRKREEISQGFCGLNVEVAVRSNGRSVSITWVLFHFRNGARTGTTAVAKPKGSLHFGIQELKRQSPEWMHELVVATEMSLRPIREALLHIKDADIAQRVAATRIRKQIGALGGAVDVGNLDADDLLSTD